MIGEYTDEDNERIAKAERLICLLKCDQEAIRKLSDAESTHIELSLETRKHLGSAWVAAGIAVSIAESRAFHLKRAIWKRVARELGMEVT